ncbi:MAG: putative motility protein [Hydrogenophilales bacterium]|nr:putative motility protein [Hydrogenophilales bacterium]
MEGIASALASNQTAYQDQISVLAIKMAAQSQQQMVALLAQAAQQAAVNPAHLGQNIDTYA